MRLRIAFYVFAGGILALLLAAKPFAAREAPFWSLHGKTDQYEPIKLRLDERGRIRTFTVSADLWCDVGTVLWRWAPSEGGAPARFSGRGPRFRAVEVHRRGPDRVDRLVIQGTVSHRRASGTREMSTEGGQADCKSDTVRWSAD